MVTNPSWICSRRGEPTGGYRREKGTRTLEPQLDSGRHAVATFPVKPCGLPGRRMLGTYPRVRMAWGPFPADDQVLWVTGPLRCHGKRADKCCGPTKSAPVKGRQPCMHTQLDSADRIDWLLVRGFDPVPAQRLVFVRWSMLEGYAQFSEFISSDDPMIETRPGFETGEQGSVTSTGGREDSAA
jgi:hypothetical protein